MNRKQRLNMLKTKYESYLNSKSDNGSICIKVRLPEEDNINLRPQSIINSMGETKVLEGTLKSIVIKETVGVIREITKEKGFLGVVKFNKQVKLITSTDLEDILKEIPFSPNVEIENSNLEKSIYISLINVLVWIEVELVSDIK